MDEAVAAVVRGKKAGEQAEVDAMAAAINAAIEALELKQAEKPETIELEIENEQGMFKAVSASLETYPDGSRVLVFALSGTGYIGMYKGTYPEAVQDKDALPLRQARAQKRRLSTRRMRTASMSSASRWMRSRHISR